MGGRRVYGMRISLITALYKYESFSFNRGNRGNRGNPGNPGNPVENDSYS